MKHERLLKVPKNFFFDRSKQTLPLGVAFHVTAGSKTQMEARPGFWSIRGISIHELKGKRT